MHLLLSSSLLALAPLSTGDAVEQDFLTVYSAGARQVFADPRDRGLLEFLGNLEGVIGAIEEGGADPAPAVVKLGMRWLAQPFGLRVALGEEGVAPFQLDVRFADQATALAELAALGDALAAEGAELTTSNEEPATLRTDTPGGPFVATARKDGTSGVVTLTFAREIGPAFAMPEVSLARGVKPAFALHFDGRALASLVPTLEANVPDSERESLARGVKVFEELGLIGKQAAPISIAVGHGELESMTTRKVLGWRKTFFGRSAAPLQKADLHLLPADTLWGWIGTFDLRQIAGIGRAVAPAETKMALDAWKTSVGIDLEQDVLGKVGPVLGAYASTKSGGGSGPMGLVLFARSANAEGFVATVEKLLTMAATAHELPIRGQPFSENGQRGLAYSLPGTGVPFEPCIAAKNGVVFLAASRGALVEAMEQTARATSVLDHPRITALSAKALENVVAFGFNDAPKGLERGYGAVGMMQATLASMMQGMGGPSGLPDLMKLVPSYTTLARGARPTVTLSYLQGDDLLQATMHDSSWTARGVAMAGSPAGQFNPMALGIIASVAIPRLLVARVDANEAAAISTLRSITSAQAQMQAAGAIDTDEDGVGEYAYFGEMSGAEPLRVLVPGIGVAVGDADFRLDPAVLSSAFAEVIADANGEGVVTRSGYVYKLWLPGATTRAGTTPGVAESAHGGAGAELPDTQNGEVLWCCYAWPMQVGQTGNRAFFVNQDGDVFEFDNRPLTGFAPYEGIDDPARMPTFDAAYFGGSLNMGESHWTEGVRANDGHYWTPIY